MVTVPKALLDLIGEGHLEYDPRTMVFSPDDNWLNFTGYQRNQLPPTLTEATREICHPADTQHLTETLDQTATSQSPQRYAHEFRLRHCLGHWIWIRSTVLIINDLNGQAVRALVRHTDISDLKQTEKMLRNSQVLAGLRDCRIEGENFLVAPAQDYGVETNLKPEWFQVSLAETVFPDDLLKVQQTIAQAQTDNQPFETGFRLLTRQRTLRHVILYGEPNADLSGRFIGIEGVFRDITEQKLSESRYVQYGKLLEGSRTGLVITRISDLSVVFVNQKYCVDSGFEKDEVLKGNLTKLICDWSADQIQELFQQLQGDRDDSEQWFHEEANMWRKDGTSFPIDAWTQVTEWEGETVVATILIDISDRRQVQHKLQQSEQKYRQLFDALPDGVLLFKEQDLIILDCNHELAQSHGWQRDELIGQPIGVITIPEHHINQARVIEALHHDSKAVSEATNRTRNGSTFPVEAHAKTVIINDETQIVTVVRDMAERQRYIRELKKQKADIEQFTYTISHDLKSPLITIKGFAEILADNLQNNQLDDAKKDLQRITRAANKMHKLLSELLDYSRLGITPHSAVSTPMTDIIHDALERTAGQIRESSAQITVQQDLPEVDGDPDRLAQLYQNLIDNAIKFRCKDREIQIQIGWNQHKSYFYVDDNGAGITETYQHKVFELFNQLDPNQLGTGIGLASAKRIIEAHGGKIWLSASSPLGGTQFCFSLSTLSTINSPNQALGPGSNVH
ncbi:MAG: PAS domain S-box protein [Immundisolibacteraceae bacterium]|nr:PAS domain S-box protein [Immundisolibacteraceae bacterium]